MQSNRRRLRGFLPLLFLLGSSTSACEARSTTLARDTPPGLSFEEPIEVARGDAVAGPWRQNESVFHYVDDPAVAAEGGMVAVVWADNEAQDIRFQAFDANGEPMLDTPANVSRSPGTFSWLPRVVIAPPLDVFVLWEEIVFSGGSHGGEIFFARSNDGGETFSPPINLSRTTAGAGKGRLTEERWDNGSLDLLRGPQGGLYVAFTEYEGALRFCRSLDGGVSFSEPLHVAGDDDEPARAPSLAVGRDGAIHLAWTVGEDPRADIRIATSADGGVNFGAARRVHESQEHSDAPKLVVDDEGVLHLVYASREGGMGGRAEVRYTRRGPGQDGFEPPRTIGPRSDRVGASYPALAVDANRRVFVAWEHLPAGAGRARGMGFSWSADGGQSFSPPALIPGTDDPELGINGSRQGSLMQKLAVTNDGEIRIVNSYFQENERSLVHLLYGRPDA